MKKLFGFGISENLFGELIWVGDLVNFDGPLLSVFSNPESNPIIYNWAETSDESVRWIIFQTSREILHNYLEGKIDHFALLSCPVNGLYLIRDSQISGNDNFVLVPQENLPMAYFPEREIYHEDDLSENIDSIRDFIGENLEDDQQSEEFIKEQLLEDSRKSNSDLLSIRVHSGKGVGPGIIGAGVLGEMLLGIQSVSYAMGDKILPEFAQGKKRVRKKELERLSRWNWYRSRAGSFIIVLKPAKTQLSLFGKDSSDVLVEGLTDLFSDNLDIDDLKRKLNKYGDETLSSYKSFLKSIKTNDVNVGVDWIEGRESTITSSGFNLVKATKLIRLIDDFELGKPKELKTKGQFYAIDRTNNTFKFKTAEDEVYSGKFSDSLKESTIERNFEDVYEVTLEITEKAKVGKSKSDTFIEMVSCIKIE